MDILLKNPSELNLQWYFLISFGTLLLYFFSSKRDWNMSIIVNWWIVFNLVYWLYLGISAHSIKADLIGSEFYLFELKHIANIPSFFLIGFIVQYVVTPSSGIALLISYFYRRLLKTEKQKNEDTIIAYAPFMSKVIICLWIVTTFCLYQFSLNNWIVKDLLE